MLPTGDPFYIHDVNFTTGDDNIAGHANNTLVEDSYFGSGHGASIGSLCGSYITCARSLPLIALETAHPEPVSEIAVPDMICRIVF